MSICFWFALLFALVKFFSSSSTLNTLIYLIPKWSSLDWSQRKVRVWATLIIPLFFKRPPICKPILQSINMFKNMDRMPRIGPLFFLFKKQTFVTFCICIPVRPSFQPSPVIHDILLVKEYHGYQLIQSPIVTRASGLQERSLD